MKPIPNRLVLTMMLAAATLAPGAAWPVCGYRIGAGFNHSLVIDSDGQVWAFGSNTAGELGDGNVIVGPPYGTANPVQVLLPAMAVAVAGGFGFSLACLADGTVWTWGKGYSGQLGDGLDMSSSRPVHAALPGPALAVDGGILHSAAVLVDGSVWTWGSNSNMSLGRWSVPLNQPGALPELANAVALSCDNDHCLVILADGQVWGWGEADGGELGYGGNPDYVMAPIPAMLGVTGARAVAAGEHHSLVVDGKGDVLATGGGPKGQLGTGAYASSLVPLATLLPAPTDPIPPDQGNILKGIRQGADVLLDFQNAPGGQTWRIYRDGVKTSLGVTPLTPDASTTQFLDPGRVTVASTDFYRLKGLSCNLTPGP